MSRPALIWRALWASAGVAAVVGAGTAADVSTTEDIRDIRGLKAVPGPSWLPLVLTGTLLAATVAYAIWRIRRRAARPPNLSLSEQTLRRLEAARALMQPASAREFGIAASEVIRVYIEKRFDAVVTQRTTEEFLQDLLRNSNAALALHRAELAEFLQRCDLVKFSGTSLAAADLESLYESARNFIVNTDLPVPA